MVKGDFQLWRANRDGTLTTDESLVPAGEDLMGEAPRPTERSSLSTKWAGRSNEELRAETSARKRAESAPAAPPPEPKE